MIIYVFVLIEDICFISDKHFGNTIIVELESHFM
jgi:hypothetical protein